MKSYKDSLTLQDCEKLTTPFSINDILTKENEKCDFENGFCQDFGGKFVQKPAGCFSKEGFAKKESLDKMKFYDDCSGYRDFADDAALDMSRKNNYPVTELSGEFLNFDFHVFF